MTVDKLMTYGGWALTILVVLFLLLDAGMKVLGAQASIDASATLGFDKDQVRLLGIVLLGPIVLYAIPQTAPLGAVLITAYLGGAIAVNLQHQTPLFSHTLFGVYVGLFVWGGLFLRMPQIQSVLPFLRG